MLRQTTPYGCGLYSVANALNEPTLVTDFRLNESIKGNTLPILNKWLFQDGFDFGIDAFYYDHFGTTIPDEHTYYRSESNEFKLPVLVEVLIGERAHMVGGTIDSEGNMTLMDSLKKFPHLTTLKEVVTSMYTGCKGVYGFTSTETSNWVLLKS